jgi:hypothetical protein
MVALAIALVGVAGVLAFLLADGLGIRYYSLSQRLLLGVRPPGAIPIWRLGDSAARGRGRRFACTGYSSRITATHLC